MGKRKYELVIFDFDGTLADTFAVFLDALEHVVEQHGLPRLSCAELERLRSGHGRALMKMLGVSPWRLPTVGATMLAAMTERRSRMRLFDGIGPALEALSRAEFVLAVVSSNSEDNVRAVLGPWAQHVAVFECGAAVFGKATKFRRVLRRTGIPADAAIAVGDELRDLEAARKAGIDFGGVAWGYTSPEALKSAGVTLFFDSPQALQPNAGPPCATDDCRWPP